MIKCNWCEKEFEEKELVLIEDVEYCPFCKKSEYLMDLDIIESLLENKIILKDLPEEEQYKVAEKTYRKIMELLNLDEEVIEFKIKDAEDVFLDEVENVSNKDFVKNVLDDVLNEIKKDIYIKVGIDY